MNEAIIFFLEAMGGGMVVSAFFFLFLANSTRRGNLLR